VTTLKGQLVAQSEQMRAQNEQLRIEKKQMKAQMRIQGDKISMVIQALMMSGLKIQLPAPDLDPPLTS